jgi:hypothetical protein
MSGAGVASAEDTEAIDINPAGLSEIDANQLSITHDIHFNSVFYDSVVFAFKTGRGTMAAGFKYLNMGNMAKTAETGEGEFLDSTGEFSGHNYMAFAGYGVRFFSEKDPGGFSAGGTLKIAGESIGDSYLNIGLAADIGGAYEIIAQKDASDNGGEAGFMAEKFRFGIAVRNAGATGAGITPVSFVIAGMVQAANAGIRGGSAVLACDLNYGINDGFKISAGAEYLLAYGDFGFALRSGISFYPGSVSLSGFSAGGRASLKNSGNLYYLDLSVTPYDILGAATKVTTGLVF